jgi:DNA invertase Pin-like site-specific DNA recombinase
MSAYLDQLHQDVLMTAVAFGMPEPEARAFAATLIDRIRTNHAGEVYIRAPDKQKRNERIRQLFNGVNHDRVCREFGISKATLYRIIKE